MIQERPPTTAQRVVDRRVAKRHMSVFLLAKITTAKHHSLGRVINLSQTGAKVETNLPLNEGDAIVLEVRSDLKVAGKVRWARNRAIGIAFDHEIDIGRFLSREQPKLNRVKARAPRYDCDAKAMVAADTDTHIVKVRDVSLSGAGLTGVTSLNRDDEVLITIFGLKPRRAKVMWVNSKGVGITFLKPLDFRDFESWLAENPASR